MKSNRFVIGCAYIYVLKLYTKKYSYRLFSFLDKCGFLSGVLSEDIVVGVALTKLYFSGKLTKL